VHFYTQGQGIWSDRRQVAGLLGLPQDAVRATLVSCGGAFGAKEDLNVQGHAALLALRTGRPVKLTLSRAESLRFHVKRHPLTMTYTLGCDAGGRLTAVRARITGDTGAYASVGRCSSGPPATAAAPTGYPLSTSRPAPSTLIRCHAVRCADSAPTRSISRSKACSTGSPG
jgi:CO/xanthine dehydrogenase Mo-binding subunit